MFNFIARLLLTSTALAPVGLTYAWVAFMQGENQTALIISVVSVLLVIICLCLLWASKSSLPVTRFRPESVEAADHENTAFLILYIMPLLTSKFDSLDWQFWLPTVLIFAIITATGYHYHFNPLLSLFGWHFYKVGSREGITYVLITRKYLRTAATELRVGQLTEYILIDVGG